HWHKTWVVDVDDRAAAPRLLWDLSSDDRYNKPGAPMHHLLSTGALAVRQVGGGFLTVGAGATPTGERPFLDRIDLGTLKAERLFRADEDAFEVPIDWLDGAFLTRRESPTEPPNVQLRSVGGPPRALTHEPDRTPQLRAIEKRLVTYKRPDGVQLS